MNDNKGEGGGLKKERALINYLLLKREDLLERGGNSLRREGGFKRGFTVANISAFCSHFRTLKVVSMRDL